MRGVLCFIFSIVEKGLLELDRYSRIGHAQIYKERNEFMVNYVAISAPTHGSGKTTFATYLEDSINKRFSNEDNNIKCIIMPFAETLKDMVNVLLGERMCPFCYNDKEAPDSRLNNKSIRFLMQTLGATLRNTINEDVWINSWYRKAKRLEDSHHNYVVVVDDLRYLNEYNKLKELGTVTVYIDRDLPVDCHESERNIMKEMCDYYIKNDVNSLFEFEQKCKPIVDEIISNFKWDNPIGVVGSSGLK